MSNPSDPDMMATECLNAGEDPLQAPPHWPSQNGMNVSTATSSSLRPPQSMTTADSSSSLPHQRPSAQDMLKRAGQQRSPMFLSPSRKPNNAASPFIKRPQNHEQKAAREINLLSIPELQDALTRNENLMQTEGVAERFGERLQTHHDLMAKRLQELRGVHDIRMGVENAHISSPPSDVNMSEPRGTQHLSQDQFTIKKEEGIDTFSALEEDNREQTQNTSSTFQQPSSRDLSQRQRIHSIHMRKLTAEPNFQNSRTMFVPVEEALRIETVEALREKEERERAQARLERLGKEGLARIRSRAVAEYLAGNVDEDEESFYEDLYGNNPSDDDDDADGADGGDGDEGDMHADDMLESLGQFGQAYMDGYNRKQDAEYGDNDDDDDTSSRKVKLEDEEFR